MAWEEIRIRTQKEAEPWDYHEKVSLEGYVEMKKENTDHEGRKYLTVILKTHEGERYFLPRNVDLQLKLKDVEEGDKLHIRHAGEEELPDGRTIRRFKVYKWIEP